jgi:hypothetical protein
VAGLMAGLAGREHRARSVSDHQRRSVAPSPASGSSAGSGGSGDRRAWRRTAPAGCRILRTTCRAHRALAGQLASRGSHADRRASRGPAHSTEGRGNPAGTSPSAVCRSPGTPAALGSEAMEATDGEVSKQLAPDLAPHHARKPASTPPSTPTHPPTCPTATRRGRPMVHQHEPQRGK